MTDLEKLAAGMPVKDKATGVTYSIKTPTIIEDENCATPQETVSSSINPQLIGGGGSNVVTFNVVNDNAFPVDLIFGTPASQAGKTDLYGLGSLVNAADFVDSKSDGFDAVETIQDFGLWCSRHGILMRSTQVFTTDQDQVKQQIRRFQVNSNRDSKIIKGRYTKYDSDDNFAYLTNCIQAITQTQGLTYRLLENQEVDWEFDIMAEGIVENFTDHKTL